MGKKKTWRQDRPITLRPVVDDDEEFLFRVYAGTRREEMARLTWDQALKDYFLRSQFAEQYREYRSRFGESGHRIILLDGRMAGRIWVFRGEAEIRLIDLAFLPEEGSTGAVTKLIEELLAEATLAGKSVRLMALKFEDGLLQLCKSLGFRVVGESDTRYQLEWLSQETAVTARSDG